MFKLQWCERGENDVAKTILIRTDQHPQSLLDSADLCFQGAALDGNKCWEQRRWWRVLYLQLEGDHSPVVAFKSFQNGELLAATPDGTGVELIGGPDNQPVAQIPARALWRLSVVEHALSPAQVASLCFAPFVAAAAAVGGGAAAVGIITFFAAQTTIGSALTFAAISTGAAVAGIAGGATTVSDCLKGISAGYFVDW